MCDYQSTRQGSLRRHKKSIHEGVQYPCQICEYKSAHQSSLSDHIKSKHKDIDGYLCTSYEMKYTTKKGLSQQRFIQENSFNISVVLHVSDNPQD